jgi:NADH-quinone oxidoreductase subunit H
LVYIGEMLVMPGTGRAPFDLPEAESELVAGFFTEHSAISFACFFLGEYTNMVTISTLFFILFLGFIMIPMVPVAVVFVLFMIWIRASLARLRFDQLVHLGWVHILPFTIAFILIIPCLLSYCSKIGMATIGTIT